MAVGGVGMIEDAITSVSVVGTTTSFYDVLVCGIVLVVVLYVLAGYRKHSGVRRHAVAK